MVQTFSLLERYPKKKRVPIFQKQLSDFMETSYKLFDVFLIYFAKIKIAENNLNWSINYVCLTLSFNFLKTKKEEE